MKKNNYLLYDVDETPPFGKMLILALQHVLAMFGATILVAGNIPGKTQTLPMAMYNAIEANQTKTTIIILFVILSISILLIIIYHNLNKDKI